MFTLGHLFTNQQTNVGILYTAYKSSLVRHNSLYVLGLCLRFLYRICHLPVDCGKFALKMRQANDAQRRNSLQRLDLASG